MIDMRLLAWNRIVDGDGRLSDHGLWWVQASDSSHNVWVIVHLESLSGYNGWWRYEIRITHAGYSEYGLLCSSEPVAIDDAYRMGSRWDLRLRTWSDQEYFVQPDANDSPFAGWKVIAGGINLGSWQHAFGELPTVRRFAEHQ